MGGAYGTPCSGELQFWSVMQSQMREQSKQLERIADALEARNASETREKRTADVDCAALRKSVADGKAMINGWHTAGDLAYRQYNHLFDLLDSVLAAIPKGGAQ